MYSIIYEFKGALYIDKRLFFVYQGSPQDTLDKFEGALRGFEGALGYQHQLISNHVYRNRCLKISHSACKVCDLVKIKIPYIPNIIK